MFSGLITGVAYPRSPAARNAALASGLHASFVEKRVETNSSHKPPPTKHYCSRLLLLFGLSFPLHEMESIAIEEWYPKRGVLSRPLFFEETQLYQLLCFRDCIIPFEAPDIGEAIWPLLSLYPSSFDTNGRWSGYSA